MKLKIEAEDRAEKEKIEKRRQEQIHNFNYNKEAMRLKIQERAEGLKLTQLLNRLEENEENKKDLILNDLKIWKNFFMLMLY